MDHGNGQTHHLPRDAASDAEPGAIAALDLPDAWMPQPHEEGTPYSPEHLRCFVQILANNGGNVSAACKSTGYSKIQMYKHRARNPDFARAWAVAVAIGTEALEDEARRRAFQGWLEPVHHRGKRVDLVRRYSDGLLKFLLKGRKPGVFAPARRLEVTGEGGGPIGVVHGMNLTGLRKLIGGFVAEPEDPPAEVVDV